MCWFAESWATFHQSRAQKSVRNKSFMLQRPVWSNNFEHYLRFSLACLPDPFTCSSAVLQHLKHLGTDLEHLSSILQQWFWRLNLELWIAFCKNLQPESWALECILQESGAFNLELWSAFCKNLELQSWALECILQESGALILSFGVHSASIWSLNLELWSAFCKNLEH